MIQIKTDGERLYIFFLVLFPAHCSPKSELVLYRIFCALVHLVNGLSVFLFSIQSFSLRASTISTLSLRRGTTAGCLIAPWGGVQTTTTASNSPEV